MSRRALVRRGLAAALAASLAASLAAAAAAQELVPYRVQPGDTLYALAERHLADAADWRLLARINRVHDPKRLAPGRVLMLPASRLRGTAQAALVAYVRGAVDRLGPDGRPAGPLAAGDALGEGAVVQVGRGAFATLRLPDGSLLHLEAGSRFVLERLREVEALRRRATVIRLDDGRVDATVSPQPPGSRFDVRTPLAVAGVRGTRFGVSFSARDIRMLSDVVEGRVAMTAPALAGELAMAAGEGAVVARAGAPPRLRPLLPAAALSVPEAARERFPFTLPITPVAGAVAYRVRIGSDDAFTQVVFSEPAATLPVVLPSLPDGRYLLKVRGVDADGLPGAEAVAALRVKATPVPPLAQLPAPGQVFGPGTVALRCTEVPGAVGYVLQVSRGAGFDAPDVAQHRSSGDCRFEIVLREPGDYHWRVATVARDARGEEDRGPFGDAGRFVVRALPPAPSPRSEGSDPRQIHWAGEPGARWQVQVASDLGFAAIVRDFETHEPRARLDVPAGCEPYYVRLRTLDAQGLRSPFSAPRRLGAAAGLCTADGRPATAGDGSGIGRSPP